MQLKKNDLTRFLEDLDIKRVKLEEEEKLRLLPDSSAGPSVPERRGWLFKKKQGKALVATWKRVYGILSHSVFSYCSSGKNRGEIVQSSGIHVLLCEVKVTDSLERRFCFEMNSAKRYFVFQAENEADLQEWINAFELSKKEAVEASSDPQNPLKFTPVGTQNLTKALDPSLNRRNATIQDDDGTKRDTQKIFQDALYSTPCSLQKEVSVQGRIYLSYLEMHFFSEIFGTVTHLVKIYYLFACFIYFRYSRIRT